MLQQYGWVPEPYPDEVIPTLPLDVQKLIEKNGKNYIPVTCEGEVRMPAEHNI